MNLMYRAGADVEGPSSPTRLRICVDSAVNSQSSMKSHRWKSDISWKTTHNRQKTIEGEGLRDQCGELKSERREGSGFPTEATKGLKSSRPKTGLGSIRGSSFTTKRQKEAALQ